MCKTLIKPLFSECGAYEKLICIINRHGYRVDLPILQRVEVHTRIVLCSIL